ncbi:MAG: hypothetical protein WA674_15475 [Candidatus Acidiferrales bacterium]
MTINQDGHIEVIQGEKREATQRAALKAIAKQYPAQKRLAEQLEEEEES